MPYTQAENNEISTVDNNQSVDDNILSKNELSTSTNLSETAVSQRPVPPSFAQAQAAQTGMSSFGQNTNVVVNRSNYQIPPPPPYSVAVNRHLDAEGSTTIATVNQATSSENNFRLQDQQQDIIRGGILPAARARLSSLRSLGSKKLTAIKMRLYDNRQKMEEYIPGSVGSSFAIMDSPSLTPEILGNNSGSFFTLQNLRSTYLISALHSQSNTLTVHTIDANLRPLFYYKIPRNCHDVLISSNILYAIQYVNVKPEETSEKAPTGSPKQESNTEKENRDTDIEKQDCYAKNEILNKNADPEKFVDELAPENRESDSVDTSATTSGRSSSSNGCGTHSSMINAVGVISSAMASCAGHEMRNKPEAVLALFRFENETVLSLYQMATDRQTSAETITKDEKMKVFAYKDIRSPIDYVQFYTTAPDKEEEFSLREMEIMQSEFPKVNYDPCYVITDKNVFYIQMKKEPFSIFLDAALASDWKQCREFCNIFDLSYETCIEFAGDYLLRRNKITQALLTYNSARVKPIRTALKLAIFGHTCALMHLCAMALKITYILKSQYFCSPMFHTILEDITYRHSEDVRLVLPKTGRDRLKEGVVNTGASCSDYIYGVDEVLSNLQMSPSSQFHLANLLLITLAEKAVNNKNYIPLWNFLAVNSKYHTNMTSIVLCQSGLYSSALLLAKVRGVWVDTFVALTSVVAQEFGWYSEFNVCLYNLSEKSFAQTLIYVPHAAVEYFSFIQEKLGQTRLCVLKRLEQQLNPFSAVLRPIVSHNSTVNTNCNSNENNAQNFDFCKALIETYLAVLIHMESQRSKRGQITNALSTFRITYEDNQFAIESSRFKPISAGYAHCACVLDGVAYFWGSNGVPCNYSLNKSSDPPEPSHAVKSLDMLHQLNLEVHTVKCGRQHTLILTNNGLYAFGNNYQSQLGVGKYTQVALQPVLVEALDGKNITTLEAGQYHNAAVADGLLYTWGWGIYGQLGHGDVENVAVPKVLAFFKFKKVLQVSLGHAHSLVLCEGANDSTTDLFVFGSNHFGQLGLGTGDELNYENQLAVDENEKMYTWGSSPQALRLANQIKRRANAKQKLEEQQRREISKQFEATVFHKTPATNEKDVSLVNQSLSMQGTNKTGVLQQTSVSLNVSKQETVENKEKNANSEVEIVKTETFASVNIASTVTVDIDANEETTPKDDNGLKIEIIEDIIEEIVPLVQPMLVEPLRPILQERKKDLKVNVSERNNEVEDTRPSTTEVDPSEHMSPYLVDTSEIAGQILQLSSGLFHFALISSTSTLYTWGKNLEHQLGTEDKERRAVNKPMALDNIESPMYVDCGADFTLVMTTDYAVKAFGGNSNGQCGRDLGPSLEKIKQRVVCLPTTKRLMRFESQCVEVPVEINLPRPSFHSNTIRYLKIIPNFQPHFVQEADINYSEVLNCIEQRSTPSRQHNMNSDNTATGQESDDIISSLENSSNNDIQSNYAGAQLAFGVESLTGSNDISSFEVTPEEQSYARLATATENQNQIQKETPREKGSANASLNQQSLLRTLTSASGVIEETDDSSEEKLQQLRHLTHYCLYIFHGLYNPERVAEFSKDRLEYRIRMHMLNFHFVDAFVLCLEDCDTAHKAVKTFEYYSKDTSFVPVRRQDLRFLIYYLIRHFLVRKLDMLECERFLLTDLDFYLLELAYVLYFNNNNTVLEQNLNQKFKNLIIQDEYQQNAKHKMEDSVIHMIFDSLSIKFKTIVCQQLLRHCSNK